MNLLSEDMRKMQFAEMAFVENEDGTYTMLKNRFGNRISVPIKLLVISKERVIKCQD